MSALGEIPAALLVGGLGTRLRSVVTATPKPLAVVGDHAFLNLLVGQLQCQGVRQVLMCTGFLADQIEQEFGDGFKWGVKIEYSREKVPLGTAGALKLARRYLHSASRFLLMNGDSFLDVDFNRLLEFHRGHGGVATLAARNVEDASRYGTVATAADGRVVGFIEKTGIAAPGLVNAGVYILNHSIFQYLPDGPASLEKDVFPQILDFGVYAAEQSGIFIDIGTPEDYARAQTLCNQLCLAAKRTWEA